MDKEVEHGNWVREGTKWMVEYTTRNVGPFTMSIRRQPDGEFTWSVGWGQSSVPLAGGKVKIYGEAVEAAEDAVANWIENAQGDLE